TEGKIYCLCFLMISSLVMCAPMLWFGYANCNPDCDTLASDNGCFGFQFRRLPILAILAIFIPLPLPSYPTTPQAIPERRRFQRCSCGTAAPGCAIPCIVIRKQAS